MPMYEVEHVTPLSEAQRDAIAEGLNKVHTTMFSTPSLFVNVRFTDISQQHLYVGGKQRRTNRIIAFIRTGPSRTREQLDQLCQECIQTWDSAVFGQKNGTNGDHANGVDTEKELRAVFLIGGLVAGAEAGFNIPAAGEDKAWIKKNWPVFVKKADSGDQDFKELVEEMSAKGWN